jgi:hypothetical protein
MRIRVFPALCNSSLCPPLWNARATSLRARSFRAT